MRDASGVAAEVPLTTLLSWTWIAYAIETDNAVEAAGADRVGRLFRISMPRALASRLVRHRPRVQRLTPWTAPSRQPGRTTRWGARRAGGTGTCEFFK
jgi:hypothetical protein